MTRAARHILIAGASGVIGAAAVERFAHMPGFTITALSRRRPIVDADCVYNHAAIDLSDREACKLALAELPPVTDLVYAAVSEAPGLSAGWRDPDLIEKNGRMFANLLEPLAARGSMFHASVLQGAKAYGAHVHPVNVPLYEDSPRDPHPNFYWLHEDLVRELGASKRFNFTIFRPQILLGFAPGAAMNPVAGIGAYLAICKERGLTAALPGESEALWEVVDAELFAEALAWAATASGARDQTFNFTNGDVFILRHAWPELINKLGLSDDGAAPKTFADFFAAPGSQRAWLALAERHNLIEASLDAFLGQSHHYLDLLLSARIAEKQRPTLLSTIKLRQAGFAACRDSFRSLQHQIGRMVELRLLPPL